MRETAAGRVAAPDGPLKLASLAAFSTAWPPVFDALPAP